VGIRNRSFANVIKVDGSDAGVHSRSLGQGRVKASSMAASRAEGSWRGPRPSSCTFSDAPGGHRSIHFCSLRRSRIWPSRISRRASPGR